MKDKKTLDAEIQSLKSISADVAFDDLELKQLLTDCPLVEFHTSEYLFQQGKYTFGFYWILKGQVDLTARILSEGPKPIETLHAGDFLGGICYIEHGPCVTSAVARTSVHCLHITPLCFEWLHLHYPNIKYKILQAISIQVCRRLKRVHDQVAAVIAGSDMIPLSFFGRVIHSLTQPKYLSSDQYALHQVVLSSVGLFDRFTEAEKQLLFESVSWIKAPKNCVLIQEEEKSASCFIVLHGAVQSSIMKDNKLAKLSVIGPGALFSGVGCVDKASEFTVNFVTCEAALLLKIPEASLLLFEKERPILWYKLFDLICESLVALGKSINKLDIRLHIETYNR